MVLALPAHPLLPGTIVCLASRDREVGGRSAGAPGGVSGPIGRRCQSGARCCGGTKWSHRRCRYCRAGSWSQSGGSRGTTGSGVALEGAGIRLVLLPAVSWRAVRRRGRRAPASRRGIQLLVCVVLVPPGCAVEGIRDVVHKLAHLLCSPRAGRIGAQCHLWRIIESWRVEVELSSVVCAASVSNVAAVWSRTGAACPLQLRGPTKHLGPRS